jgi:maltose-binding protein MalE
MSSRAKDKDLAFEAMAALTSDASAIVRAKRARQVVPNLAAYDDPAIRDDKVLAAFRAQLAHTVPMPTATAMRMVWTPYKTALVEILAGRAQPADQVQSVEREVKSYLTGPN